MYPMFIAALLTIARTWKQPNCPLKEEWIKKMWYVCIYINLYIYKLWEWGDFCEGEEWWQRNV